MNALTSLDRFNKALAIAKFKVKIRSLAHEARVIRNVAAKNRKAVFVEETHGWQWRHSVSESLVNHNRQVVRPEQRHTLLAYAFLRGRPYKSVEKPAKGNEPSPVAIARVLKSLAGMQAESAVNDWLNGSIVQKQSA